MFHPEDRPSGRPSYSVPQARGTAQVILPTTPRPQPSWIPRLVRGSAACALLAASSWLIWARGSADDRAAAPVQVVAHDQRAPEPLLDTVLGLRPTFTPTSAATPAALDSSELAQIEIVTPTPDPRRSLRVAGAPVERFAAAIPSIGKQPELMGLFPVDLQARQPVLPAPPPAPPQPLVDLAELPTVFEEVVNGPLSQIQLFTLEGVQLAVDPKPTPTAVAVLAAKPTEQPARMPPPLTLAGPARVWASFQPKLPEENDHFWIESPFLNTEFNKVAAPSYQFGSTAGGQYRPHHGIDIANRWGTPVRAAASGVVVFAGLDDPVAMGPYPNFYGNTVVIQLDRKLPVAGGEIDLFLLYGHLSRVTVAQGQRVAPDDIVGEVGMTGIAIGPHLHLEIRAGANTYQNSINPYLWVQPGAGEGAVAVRLVTADGRSWPGARLTLARFEEGRAVWGRQIETYLDNENLLPNPSWGENGAMGDVPAGYYVLIGNVQGEAVRAEFFVREGQTTFVEIRTRQ